MPLIKLQSEGLNLADNFAFTGTITGAGGGKLLQIATVNFAGDVNTSNTSLTKVSSNFEVSLTPSASSSKILILMGNGNAYVPQNREMKVHMYRKIGSGSLTAMTVSDVDGTTGDIGNVYRTTAGANQLQVPHSFNYLDSPNTTDAVTYAPYFRSNSSDAVYFNTPDGNPWVVNLTIIEVGA